MKQFIGLIIITMMIFASSSMAQAEEVTATLLLGKVEVNLWESVAAVFFHIADQSRADQRIALNDYTDDIQTVKRMLSSLEKMEILEKDRAALADIEKTWEVVRAQGDALMEIDIEKEKCLSASDSKMHDYWVGAENLDHKIDELIKAIAGSH